jgi:hypothetical protein
MSQPFLPEDLIWQTLADIDRESSGELRKLARAAKLNPRTDFRGVSLAGLSLAKQDISGFDFSGSDLRGTGIRYARIASGVTISRDTKLDPADRRWWLRKLKVSGRPTLPPNPKMIGRKDRLEELVKAILEEDRPIVVPGALGSGKTTLALAAVHDPRVVARFGKERRFFVNLEPAPNAEGVLSRIAIQLGLHATGAAHELEAKIAAACAAEPTLAILDNLETPWRNDAAATEALLGRLAALEGLRLVATVRGEPPAIGARTLRNVEQLQDADARALFLRHAGNHFGSDLALPGLLKALDGHPLSIELLAANAQGKPDLKGLAADWNDRRADLLRRGAANDRKTSLRASLDLSLAALDPPSPAHRLIRLIALLPDGMSETDSRTILSDGEPTREERGAASRLETAHLASRARGRWHVPTPVRETLLADFPPESDDRARLVAMFLPRAALGDYAGTDKWNDVREGLTAEAGNLDAMIGVAARKPDLPKGLSTAVSGLSRLYRFTGLGSCASLPAVAKRFRDAGSILEEANCILSLGEIAYTRSDLSGARQSFQAALPLYREVSPASDYSRDARRRRLPQRQPLGPRFRCPSRWRCQIRQQRDGAQRETAAPSA